MLKIYLTNLGKYNEGYLIGEWVELPVSDEELEEVKKRIGINKYYEEWFITDYESDIDGVEVNEYSNIDTLNELAEKLEELSNDEWKLDIVSACMSEGYSLDDSIEKIDDCYIWFDCSDMEDVARQYVETCGLLDEIPEHLQNYFDFESFGRDMSFEGQFVFLNNGNCIEIH